MEDKEGLNPNCAFWQMQYFSLSLQKIFFFSQMGICVCFGLLSSTDGHPHIYTFGNQFLPRLRPE